ncbi:MAG: toprim domain-containing protein [Nitrospina sp.]|nr:toprim domain-containing protein [Nitrospina sp.]
MDVEIIKRLAVGQWPEIILNFAPCLSDIIERAWKHGPCPLCGGTDRARCHNDFVETGGIFCNVCKGGADGLAVLQWANGWSFPETLEAVKSYLGLGHGQIPIARYVSPKAKQTPAKNWDNEKKRLQSVWDSSKPDTGRIAEYLECRGLSISVPDTLQLHPSINYYHQGPPVSYPCMVAEITRDGQRVGLHRTWLDPDGSGKAPCSQPRKAWKCVDSMAGGAIRLYQVEEGKPLFIAEGIETALAVRQLTGLPTWSAINSTMMAKVLLPENIQSVIICADKDKSGAGEKAAEKLAERLINEGRQVKISYPPIPIPENSRGVDWLNFQNIKEIAHV